MATINQLSNITLASLDGTEEFWVQKGGVDYRLDLADLRNYCGGVRYASLTIPTASVLTLYATPLEIVAAPGAGYAIQVISASFKLTYNSVAYATNTGLQLIADTATISQMKTNTCIDSTATQHIIFEGVPAATASDTQVIENKSLKVQVPTGNPTAGNSDITVYVCYRLITL